MTPRDAVSPQPPPRPNENPEITDLVMADLLAKKIAGRAKYGVPLQPENGRDPLIDAYQETLDRANYLRQAIEENRPSREKVRALLVLRVLPRIGGGSVREVLLDVIEPLVAEMFAPEIGTDASLVAQAEKFFSAYQKS
jgi:hypothetical protein